jgi:hypothetical protein
MDCLLIEGRWHITYPVHVWHLASLPAIIPERTGIDLLKTLFDTNEGMCVSREGVHSQSNTELNKISRTLCIFWRPQFFSQLKRVVKYLARTHTSHHSCMMPRQGSIELDFLLAITHSLRMLAKGEGDLHRRGRCLKLIAGTS